MNHGVVAFGKELLLLFQPEENENMLRMDVTEILVEPGILLKAANLTQIPALNLCGFSFFHLQLPSTSFPAVKCVLLSHPVSHRSLCDGKFCTTGAGQKRSCGTTRAVIKFQPENESCQLYENIQTFMMCLTSILHYSSSSLFFFFSITCDNKLYRPLEAMTKKPAGEVSQL